MTPTSKTTTTPSTATFAHDDPRQLFGRGIAVGTATIAAVRADQMELPTPCDEYDVRRLLGHLVAVVHRAAAIGRGDDPMTMADTFTSADDAWSMAWSSAVADAENAWRDDAALERTVVLPWATLPGGAALLGYLNEVVVHTWDLAQATSQHPTWDDDVVRAAHIAIAHALPAEGRRELFEEILKKIDASAVRQPSAGAPPFAEAVAASTDARPIDRLVAFTGRQPG